jgi:predicted NUDIX family NTP pyrophosphohydrolase
VFDPAQLRSNTFELEWPPRSGRKILVPEADRAEWFDPGEARRKLLRGQIPILDALLASS